MEGALGLVAGDLCGEGTVGGEPKGWRGLPRGGEEGSKEEQEDAEEFAGFLARETKAVNSLSWRANTATTARPKSMREGQASSHALREGGSEGR